MYLREWKRLYFDSNPKGVPKDPVNKESVQDQVMSGHEHRFNHVSRAVSRFVEYVLYFPITI